jgi:uncharacterized protein (DUF488 family)
MLFTIGYSTRTLPEFLSELRRRGITQLWDVRSSPWSRNAPFNLNAIGRWAEREGILYRPFGEVLGGRAEVSLDDPRYVAALEQLISAAQREPLAVMCSEGDPAQCHRTWEVGASLIEKYGLMARSILRDGNEEDVTDSLRRVSIKSLEVPVREIIGRALAGASPGSSSARHLHARIHLEKDF